MTTLREYHERTKHSAGERARERVRPRLGQPADPVQGLPGPRPDRAPDGPAGIAASGARRDRRHHGPPPRASMSACWRTCSTSVRACSGAARTRAARSSIARRPARARSITSMRTSCAVTSTGLAAGVHHFGPHDFALRTLRAGDHRALLVAATGDEPHAADAPVLLVLTSTFWRNAWKYRTRTYRHCFWDAGTLLANLLAVTAALGVPAHVVTGFVDDDVARLLDVDQTREAPLAVLALGGGGPPAPPASALPRSASRPCRSRAQEIDYPLIREAHAASSLATATAVQRMARRRAEPPRKSRGARRRRRSSRCRPPPSRSPSRPSSRDADRRADSRARPSRCDQPRDDPPPLDASRAARRRGAGRAPRDRQRRRRHRPRSLPLRPRRADARTACAPAISATPPAIWTSARSSRPTRRRISTGSPISTPCSHGSATAATGRCSSRRRSPGAAPISRRMRSGSGRPDSPSSTTM